MGKVSVVIGKNFGDEGKGLITDYLCSQKSPSLVIKHNGGAQAGHTVDRKRERFVFHQLSSGSFRGASVFWANTYFPDLYKLGEEVSDFKSTSGFVPAILSDIRTPLVVIDDVIINMVIESLRGNARHGSCGMGINEAFLRTQEGYGITMKEALSCSGSALAARLKDIRRDYVFPRLDNLIKKAFIDGELTTPKLDTVLLPTEYEELLRSDAVLENAADEMLRNSESVSVTEDAPSVFKSYDNIVFESGQGLLLDMEYEKYAPHLTTSHTGLVNPLMLCAEYGLWLTDVFYVSRSYVTRHGAGPLPCECASTELGNLIMDKTNLENLWQGRIRYGKHISIEEFIGPVREDLKRIENLRVSDKQSMPQITLCLTHMNETMGKICFETKDRSILELCKNQRITDIFDVILESDSPFSEDVKIVYHKEKQNGQQGD